MLIGAGVLFLLIGAVIAAGINLPGTDALSDTGDESSSASTPAPKQTPTTTEQVPDTTTQTTQMTTQTTTQPTETATPSPTPTTQTTTTTEATRTAASGGLSIVDTTDRNGNGYVSDFNITVKADTRLPDRDPDGNGDPYLSVKINGQPFGQTDVLTPSPNGAYTIGIEPSDLQRYKQGPLQVTVQLMDKDSGQDEQINTWTKTVKYESE